MIGNAWQIVTWGNVGYISKTGGEVRKPESSIAPAAPSFRDLFWNCRRGHVKTRLPLYPIEPKYLQLRTDHLRTLREATARAVAELTHLTRCWLCNLQVSFPTSMRTTKCNQWSSDIS